MQSVVAKNGESHPLVGYKFSINDFKTSQVNQLVLSCLQFSGNKKLKSRLNEEIHAQRREKTQFYNYVKWKRLENLCNDVIREILEKWHFPKSWSSSIKNETANEADLNIRKWQLPENVQDIVSKTYPKEESIAALQPDALQISGWERLKRAFLPKLYVFDYCPYESSHVYNYGLWLNFVAAIAAPVGFLMAFPYGRRYKQEFEATSASNMYESKSMAFRARNEAVAKGYFRYAFRWGWRFAFISGGVYLISQGLSIYRLKESFSHYIIGCFFPFAAYKWFRGPKGMLVYGTMGALFFGIPLGLLLGVLGVNPRPMLYNAGVLPELKSKYHYYNWSKEQEQTNEIRYAALSRLLNKPALPDADKDELDNLYNEMLPNYDVSD